MRQIGINPHPGPTLLSLKLIAHWTGKVSGFVKFQALHNILAGGRRIQPDIEAHKNEQTKLQ